MAQHLSFLKFQRRAKRQLQAASQDWGAAYREAADDDRALAEAGLSEYATNLASEDA